MKHKNHNSFIQTVTILLIILLCILFAFILVWPLWKFATSFSSAYTFTILALIGAGLIYLIAKKIRITPVKKTVRFVCNIVLICAGLYTGIIFLLAGKRFLFIVVILIDALLITGANLVIKKLLK